MNPPLTIDQATWLLSIFRAQNAEKTLGDLFPKRKDCRDVLIGKLDIHICFDRVGLVDDVSLYIKYETKTKNWKSWNKRNDTIWFTFNIFDYITLKDNF